MAASETLQCIFSQKLTSRSPGPALGQRRWRRCSGCQAREVLALPSTAYFPCLTPSRVALSAVSISSGKQKKPNRRGGGGGAKPFSGPSAAQPKQRQGCEVVPGLAEDPPHADIAVIRPVWCLFASLTVTWLPFDCLESR